MPDYILCVSATNFFPRKSFAFDWHTALELNNFAIYKLPFIVYEIKLIKRLVYDRWNTGEKMIHY